MTGTVQPVPEQIRERLQAAFAPSELEVLDEGHKHACLLYTSPSPRD